MPERNAYRDWRDTCGGMGQASRATTAETDAWQEAWWRCRAQRGTPEAGRQRPASGSPRAAQRAARVTVPKPRRDTPPEALAADRTRAYASRYARTTPEHTLTISSERRGSTPRRGVWPGAARDKTRGGKDREPPTGGRPRGAGCPNGARKGGDSTLASTDASQPAERSGATR